MLIINSTLGVYGGSMTLIERLCTWAAEKRIAVSIYCNDQSNKELVERLHELNTPIYCFDTKKYSTLRNKLLNDTREGEISVLSFTFEDYLNVERAKKSLNLEFANIVYCIHPETFFKGKGIPLGVLKRLMILHYKKVVDRLNSVGGIFFMDRDTIQKTEKYYSMTFSKKPSLLPLPMICNELPKEDLCNKIDHSYASKTIITACRSDFPYKGYLFGLIDCYVELKKKHQSIKLVIVSAGEADDVHKVKEKILSVRSDYRCDIHFYNWMEYHELVNLISKSYMFVGMGTSVLDSALSYTPSVAVKYNTYECISDSLFCEKPETLVSEETCSSPASVIIARLLNCSRDEYASISIKTFLAARQVYDIERFFSELSCVLPYKSCLSTFDIMIHVIFSYINSFRKHKAYAADAIEYEAKAK